MFHLILQIICFKKERKMFKEYQSKSATLASRGLSLIRALARHQTFLRRGCWQQQFDSSGLWPRCGSIFSFFLFFNSFLPQR